MHTQRFYRILFCTLFSCFSAAAQPQSETPPNVIIILADDLGYGDVSSNNPYSQTKTPNIDMMAKRGMAFTDAHSGGALCTPSRYGLITGRYFFRVPQQKGYMGYLPPHIEQGRETIGTLLKKAGYTTACIGKWHLGLNWKLKDSSKPQIPVQKDKTGTNTDFTQSVSGGPNSLGFDYSFILPASLDMPPYVFVKNNRVVDPEITLTADAYPKTLTGTVPVWDRKYTDENDIYWERGVWWRNGEMSKSFKLEDCFSTIVNEGVSFINNQARNNPKKPFMLYLPLTGPHTPWLPDEKFKGKTMMGTYGDFVSQVDDAVGQILNTLKSLNIDQNTMVVFSSDNGGHWSEEDIQLYAHQSNYSRRGQKGDVWDGGHHIPLIIQWPAKIKPAATYTHTVSLVDMMATFADMTKQQISEKYAEDSFSLYEILTGGLQKPVRENIIYLSGGSRLAIKKDEWKFIEGLGSAGFTAPASLQPVKGGPKGQLYNLDSDPLEKNNLYLQNPAKVKELSALLHKLKTQGFSRMSR